MLDLKAEVAAHQVHQPPALDVGRAHELAQIPAATGFVLNLFFGELVHALREVPAEDDHVGPQVADQVGRHIGQQHGQEERAGQSREQHVVLHHLLARLLPEALQLGPGVLANLACPGQLIQLGVVHAHPPLEEHRQQGVVDRVGDDAAIAMLLTGNDRCPTPSEIAAPGLWIARVSES